MTASLRLTLAPSGALCVQHEDHPVLELPHDPVLAVRLMQTMLQAAANAVEGHFIGTAAAPVAHDIREITRKGGFDVVKRLCVIQCPRCGGTPAKHKHTTGETCSQCFGEGKISHIVSILQPSGKLSIPKDHPSKVKLSDLFDDDEDGLEASAP